PTFATARPLVRYPAYRRAATADAYRPAPAPDALCAARMRRRATARRVRQTARNADGPMLSAAREPPPYGRIPPTRGDAPPSALRPPPALARTRALRSAPSIAAIQAARL